jgi:hypothetical protein
MIGLLHPQRVEVLHALALLAGGREPLPEGLERLAAEDPLLRPWAARLAPRLRAGEALGPCLIRARLVTSREAFVLNGKDPSLALAHVAQLVTRPQFRLTVVRWFPTVLTLSAAVSFNLALWAVGDLVGISSELGWRTASLGDCVASGVVAVVGVAVVQYLLTAVRGLRHLQHLWCPAVHRAAAWHDLVTTIRWGGDAVAHPGPGQRAWQGIRLSAQRSGRPAWDLPWRTWLFLTRFRLSRAQRRHLRSLPHGAERLAALGVHVDADASRHSAELLDAAVAAAWPILVVALWVAVISAFFLGLIQGFPIFMGMQSLG